MTSSRTANKNRKVIQKNYEISDFSAMDPSVSEEDFFQQNSMYVYISNM